MIRLIVCIILFLFFLSLPTIAQDMHVFIIVQNAPNVGTTADKNTIQDLLKKVEKSIPKLKINTKVINGEDASKIQLEKELDSIRITSDDIVWFYYTGHGENYDTYPMTDQHEVPLTWIYNKLISTNARLTITMFDSCNWHDPIVGSDTSIGWTKVPPNFYKYLFMKSKGHIKISSCSSTQFSWGSINSGSFFTNAFVDAIDGKSSWKKVLQETSKMTEQAATLRNKKQKPQYEFSYGFQDGNYKN